jgi:hypothetical protein
MKGFSVICHRQTEPICDERRRKTWGFSKAKTALGLSTSSENGLNAFDRELCLHQMQNEISIAAGRNRTRKCSDQFFSVEVQQLASPAGLQRFWKTNQTKTKHLLHVDGVM